MESGEERELVSAAFARRSKTFPPSDIILYLSQWISFIDEWDTAKCHPSIVITREDLLDEDGKPFQEDAHCIERDCLGYTDWYHAFGKDVVEKGQKHKWNLQFMKCKDEASVSIIGIIDEQHIDPHLESFCLYKECGGYGLECWNNTFVHGAHHGSGIRHCASIDCSWSREFAIIRMELDMTHSNENGEIEPVLSFCKCDRNGVIQRRIDWDGPKIDGNRKYRLCVSFYHNNSKIALIH